MSVAEAVLRWWLAFSLVSVACAPIVWWLGAGLGPYRHALLRPVSLVVATFVVWWPAALIDLPFQRATVVGGVLALGAASWALFLRTRPALRGEVRSMLVFEVVWVIGILGYVAFRAANPDIANTEKPMEIALLSSVTRSTEVPAPDPWYAGSAINYYYFGYQSVATLIHLSGVEASVAFNLMLGSLFASTLTVAAGLGAWLAERARLGQMAIWAAGALAGFFVALAGNLETFTRLVRAPGETVSAGWWDGVGWNASRVIVDSGINGNPAAADTINEFPAFSFILGDLHPHLTTLPVLLATIAFACGLALDPRRCTFPRAAAVGGLAGLLYASNSWDAPVGVVVVLGAVWLAFGRHYRAALERSGVALLGAVLAALPFALSYTAPVGVETNDIPAWLARVPVLGTLPNTVAIVTWRPSSTGELLLVHGVWIGCGLLFGLWTYLSSDTLQMQLRANVGIVAPLALLLAAGAVAWAPALVLLGLPSIWFVAVALFDRRDPVRLVAALFACGFGLALVSEFLYIQDSFGSRMNTVFKLNFQAWIFLGLAAAAGLAIVAVQASRSTRRAGLALAVVAVAFSAPYAPLSAEDWMDMGLASGTLDGAAYLATTNPTEARGIDWLATHAEEGDVIVELPGCAYASVAGVPMNRFSAFTGVPTLLGWANHEGQWRRGEFDDYAAVLAARDALANSWLDGRPGPTPTALEPRFVIIGAVERATGNDCAKLRPRGQMEVEALAALGWSVAFEEGSTTILARADDPALRGQIERD